MRVPGVVVDLAWWNVSGIFVNSSPPPSPSPSDIIPQTVVYDDRAEDRQPFIPGSASPKESPVDHIDPVFGAAMFFLAGIAKQHPSLKWPAFAVGVTGAVLNYGAERAGAQDGSNWHGVGGGGGF
tara:strand:+ start:270 stop:644 length:375 start_codon:yes stop_codon:yes gene_type:complete